MLSYEFCLFCNELLHSNTTFVFLKQCSHHRSEVLLHCEATTLKCFALGQQFHDLDSNPHSSEFAIRTWVQCPGLLNHVPLHWHSDNVRLFKTVWTILSTLIWGTMDQKEINSFRITCKKRDINVWCWLVLTLNPRSLSCDLDTFSITAKFIGRNDTLVCFLLKSVVSKIWKYLFYRFVKLLAIWLVFSLLNVSVSF